MSGYGDRKSLGDTKKTAYQIAWEEVRATFPFDRIEGRYFASDAEIDAFVSRRVREIEEGI